MLRKSVVILLIVMVTNLITFAGDATDKSQITEKVKSEIAKLGTGEDAKVSVTLKSGATIKGYVSEIKSDSFVVTNEKTGTTTEIPYSEAKQVKGRKASTGAKIAIGIGVIGGLLVFLGIVSARID